MQRPRVPLPQPLDSTPFTPSSARDVGIYRGRLRGSDLEHPFHSVYVPPAVELGVAELCAALATRVRGDAFFCGPTAAQLYGIPLPSRIELEYTTHVAVPAPATAPVGRGVTGHSYRIVDSELTKRHGITLTTPARTWCELSLVLTLDELIAAGDYLIHHERRMSSRNDLAEMMRRYPARRGRATRSAAILELHDRSESPRETSLRLIITRGRVGGLHVNYPIRTSGGFDYRADLAFPGAKVIVEYQSRFHDSADRQVRDRTRRSQLQADGWLVIEVSAEDLRYPEELLARIRRTVAARS